MKEIPFPDGVMPLEIFVGSIGKDRVTEAADGRPGVVDYGFNYTDRPVSLFLRIKAKDKTDFRLLRNEVFATFDVGSAFYVAEADVPSRVLKVVVDESYIPDRLTEEYADFDINCRTLDSVFWESKYTTLELHDSGYSATAEKYGLVDNIDDEKVQYRFEPGTSMARLDGRDFKYGFLSSSNGNESSNDRNIIMSDTYQMFRGVEYHFSDPGSNPNVLRYYLYEYDASGNFIRSHVTGTDKIVSFISTGTRLKIMAQATSGNAVNIDGLGTDILPRVRRPNVTNSFTVYNAGNVTVEPESMMLDIFVSTVRSDNNFTIRNKTTGEEIILKRASNGSHFRIRGMVCSFGSFTNIFRDTNRRFISLAPGDNEFEILNGTFREIRFDFKYLYK